MLPPIFRKAAQEFESRLEPKQKLLLRSDLNIEGEQTLAIHAEFDKLDWHVLAALYNKTIAAAKRCETKAVIFNLCVNTLGDIFFSNIAHTFFNSSKVDIFVIFNSSSHFCFQIPFNSHQPYANI